jgi:hypothetical protein
MPLLSPAEKFELCAIPVAIGLAAWFAPRPDFKLELGELTAGAALLILLQGFIRDLWLLREARRNQSATGARAARCMCVESTVGLTGVVAGIALVGLGLTHPITLNRASAGAVVAVVLIAGFLLKDFVFEWSPWKIYREKNHAQVIFRWGK